MIKVREERKKTTISGDLCLKLAAASIPVFILRLFLASKTTPDSKSFVAAKGGGKIFLDKTFLLQSAGGLENRRGKESTDSRGV